MAFEAELIHPQTTSPSFYQKGSPLGVGVLLELTELGGDNKTQPSLSSRVTCNCTCSHIPVSLGTPSSEAHFASCSTYWRWGWLPWTTEHTAFVLTRLRAGLPYRRSWEHTILWSRVRHRLDKGPKLFLRSIPGRSLVIGSLQQSHEPLQNGVQLKTFILFYRDKNLNTDCLDLTKPKCEKPDAKDNCSSLFLCSGLCERVQDWLNL